MIRIIAWCRFTPAMALIAMALAACVLAVQIACTATQVMKADSVQAEITKLCGIAIPLASLDPAVGVYAQAACVSEEMIAKLALDPHTVAWLQGIIAQLKKARG